MLKGRNIVVLDLETAKSASDCLHCGLPQATCEQWASALGHDGHTFEPIGWGRKVELGLSIGCWWDYQEERLHWFDRYTLEMTMRELVLREPLLVSFNGIQFDFALMRALLRREHDQEYVSGHAALLVARAMHELCDNFKALCATSYDILAEIWQADPTRRERGLNSLDAISQANNCGAKSLHGALAPKLWAQGRFAEVIQYCGEDVEKTRKIFEKILTNKGSILRGDGKEIILPIPNIP